MIYEHMESLRVPSNKMLLKDNHSLKRKCYRGNDVN